MRSDRWKFGEIVVRHGTPARRVLSFQWSDRTPRDLSGLAGVFSVFTARGGPLLFPEVAMAEGSSTDERILLLTKEQCTQAGTLYYSEIEFRDGDGAAVADGGWYGEFRVEGK